MNGRNALPVQQCRNDNHWLYDVREELRKTPAKVERILYTQRLRMSECRKEGRCTLVKAIRQPICSHIALSLRL